MQWTDHFIKRPVLAVCISLFITLLGLQSIRNLEIEQYPKTINPVVTVSTTYYGASASLIESFITAPLERAIAKASNIETLSSKSTMGLSTISVKMRLNTSPSVALADVLAEVNAVRSSLPSAAEDPTVSVSTGAEMGSLFISFTSKQLSTTQVTDYLTRVIQPQLLTVPGIASVNIVGGSDLALRIWLDPLKLAQYNLTTSEVLAALQQNNYQSATGKFEGELTIYNSTATTQANSVALLEQLPIKRMGSQIIRVADLSRVELGAGRESTRAFSNGREAVFISIDAAPDANPLTVAHGVKALLPTLQENLIADLDMTVLYDATESIESSIYEVLKTIVEAAVIVTLVILCFLGSWRTVVIPLITIPISLIGALGLMHLAGASINLMTLLGLVLAIGLVVDDAIVVLENIERRHQQGEPIFKAAIFGTREIAQPVISMTITLATVYSPLLFMQGLTGTLFREFAMTLAGAVCISGILALTLSPMMCLKLFEKHREPSNFEQYVQKQLARFNQAYERLLDICFQHQRLVLTFALISLLLLPLLLKCISQELAPTEDRSTIMFMANAPATANLNYTEQGMLEIAQLLGGEPAVERSLCIAGMGGTRRGMSMGMLVDPSKRKQSQGQILNAVSQKVTRLPRLSVSAFAIPELPGVNAGPPVQFHVTTAKERPELFNVASEIETAANRSGLFLFSQLDLKYDSASVQLQIDHEKSAYYGIDMKTIGDTLASFLAEGTVNRVEMDGFAYEVIAEADHVNRLTPDRLNRYMVKTSTGVMLPLSEIISIRIAGEPESLTRLNQLHSATIIAVPKPGTSMGDSVTWFQKLARKQLPEGYYYEFGGEAKQFLDEGHALLWSFLVSVLIIFLVLAIQFESWNDGLVILISVPLAISGALSAMAWGLCSLNIYSQVGLITLVGLITKHGILLCEVAKEHQLEEQLDRISAIKKACQQRLRPIVMTTAAMVSGLFPLLAVQGPGAEARFSIGLVLVVGLSVGTLFTLFVLPVIYPHIATKHQPLPEL